MFGCALAGKAALAAGNAGMPLERAMAVYDRLGRLVQECPQPMYSKYQATARARIERVDADDWPVIACALALECPIWTEDRDFFGAGVPTWTTDRVELYLANAEPPQSGEPSDDRHRPVDRGRADRPQPPYRREAGTMLVSLTGP